MQASISSSFSSNKSLKMIWKCGTYTYKETVIFVFAEFNLPFSCGGWFWRLAFQVMQVWAERSLVFRSRFCTGFVCSGSSLVLLLAVISWVSSRVYRLLGRFSISMTSLIILLIFDVDYNFGIFVIDLWHVTFTSFPRCAFFFFVPRFDVLFWHWSSNWFIRRRFGCNFDLGCSRLLGVRFFDW